MPGGARNVSTEAGGGERLERSAMARAARQETGASEKGASLQEGQGLAGLPEVEDPPNLPRTVARDP